jgi:hypothetical protein
VLHRPVELAPLIGMWPGCVNSFRLGKAQQNECSVALFWIGTLRTQPVGTSRRDLLHGRNVAFPRSAVLLGTVHTTDNLGSIPRSLLRIPSHQDAPYFRSRLTHVFHFLCVFASGNLRGVLGSKTAISFQEFAGVYLPDRAILSRFLVGGSPWRSPLVGV